MIDPPTGRSALHNLTTVILFVAVVGAVAACCYGIYTALMTDNLPLGLGFFIGGVAGLLIGLLLYVQVALLQKFVSYSYRGYEALLTAAELQHRQEEHMRLIAENSSLSEWAKRVVYREKDCEFLRDTIHAAIIRQDWESAEHLIRDMDTQFGYHEQAAKLRAELDQARKATVEERVVAAVSRIDKLCAECKWQQALAECQRLQLLYSDEPQISALSARIDQYRGDFKQKLLRQYEDAVRLQDIDRAHRLLFMLDQYLVPAEVESIKESARTVFRARLEQIKTRFSIAVSYKQFHNAIAAGEQLIREFPNSGYAQEISKLLPTLRERATQQPGLSAHHAAHGTSPATN